jgi:hypothetical protein
MIVVVVMVVRMLTAAILAMLVTVVVRMLAAILAMLVVMVVRMLAAAVLAVAVVMVMVMLAAAVLAMLVSVLLFVLDGGRESEPFECCPDELLHSLFHRIGRDTEYDRGDPDFSRARGFGERRRPLHLDIAARGRQHDGFLAPADISLYMSDDNPVFLRPGV